MDSENQKGEECVKGMVGVSGPLLSLLVLCPSSSPSQELTFFLPFCHLAAFPVSLLSKFNLPCMGLGSDQANV